ncbi:MAG: M67 family metallopeptidase [Actinomycetota bacterium]
MVVPKNLHREMVDHCRRGLPNEACGFLAGRDGTAERIYPLTNAAASPVYYRPADKEMLAAMNEIDARGLELVAIFHSHVASRAYPSPTDVREAHYPDSVYVIVSMAQTDRPEARGYLIKKQDWRDEHGDVEEIDLVLS